MGTVAKRRITLHDPVGEVDLRVHGHGNDTVLLLEAASPAGKAWLAAHVAADAQRLGQMLAVENRFIRAITDDAVRDGLRVR